MPDFSTESEPATTCPREGRRVWQIGARSVKNAPELTKPLELVGSILRAVDRLLLVLREVGR
jgi:hypothetical protein